jgi:Leucine-rich repeat (LRR) protein
LYIKGKYKEGERNGYFDIVDKEKGINTNHQYISFIQTRLINEYNKKYKENINGKEVSISITCRNNPINQLKDFISIRFSNLLTLDLTRSNIDSISFLNNDESTLFSLQNLILSYNNISDINPLVNVDYKKLKTLILNDNKIEDIDCVKEFDFKELEELNLSSNPIKSIEGIKDWKFPKLFNLSFSRTDIRDITPLYEADFPNLVQIDLYLIKIKKKKENKNDKKDKNDKNDKNDKKVKNDNKDKKDKDEDEILALENFKKCKNLKNIISDRYF